MLPAIPSHHRTDTAFPEGFGTAALFISAAFLVKRFIRWACHATPRCCGSTWLLWLCLSATSL